LFRSAWYGKLARFIQRIVRKLTGTPDISHLSLTLH
jgi:hypothetical protein